MKNKRFNINTLLFISGLLLALNSCTKNFESYNTDDTGIEDENVNLASTFGSLETAIWNNYQVEQNLSADAYSGYMMTPHQFAVQSNQNYALNDGWNSSGYVGQYTGVLGPIINKVIPQVRQAQPDLFAVALIIKVEAAHRIADKFGPMPYSKIGTSLTSIPFDSMDTLYNEFFADLDTAVTNLSTYISSNPGKTQLGNGYDAIYNGDYTKWLKFANSLRLRLAMHIAKVAPDIAKAQVQKALSASGGLMETPDDDAATAQQGGRTNDIYVCSYPYSDNNLNATMGCFLTGYKDPRASVYATPASGPSSISGQYVGIRTGIDLGTSKAYYSFSNLNAANSNTSIIGANAPQQLMTAAEVWFLRAEAALREWSSENAETDYNKGITTSMQQWNIAQSAINTYINDAASKEANYTDPLNSSNNAAALSTITVKWDAGATNEQKLERIITQKWLAMFPEGQEAWTEFRRTGYPKLFPVLQNFSNGTIDTDIQIRRIPYPASVKSSNAEAYQAALSMLNGDDNGGTRLWWDTGKSNF